MGAYYIATILRSMGFVFRSDKGWVYEDGPGQYVHILFRGHPNNEPIRRYFFELASPLLHTSILFYIP